MEPTAEPFNPPRASYPRWQTALCAAALVLLVFATFFPALRAGFVAFDDEQSVYGNPFLNPVTAQTLPRFWGEAYYQLYTPVTSTLWAAVAALPAARLPTAVPVPAGGAATLSAAPFHTLGVAVHAANALLVFVIVLRLPLLRGRSPLYAACGAAAFAICPLQAESVAWVTGNNNVFGGFFLFAALLCTVRWIAADRTRNGWYFAATGLFLLALLAKPTAAVLPLVAFALATLVYRVPARALLLPFGVWLLLAGALLFVTQNTTDPVTDVSLPVWQRPFVAGDALAFYAAKLVLPVSLGIDYGRKPEWLRGQGWFYAAWLVPAAIGTGLAFWHRRTGSDTARYLLAGAAVFLAGVAPTLGFAVYYFQRFSTVADRYVYVALLGVAVAVAAALTRTNRRVSLPTAAVVLGIWAVLCARQTAVWHDSETLYTHAIRVNGRSRVAHHDLALALNDRGDTTGAIREEYVAQACPSEGHNLDAAVHGSQGALLFRAHRYAESAREYVRAITIAPEQPEAYWNLAVSQLALGDRRGAERTLAAAASIGNRADAVYNTGVVMLSCGADELAAPYLREAARGGSHAADAARLLARIPQGKSGTISAP